MTTLTTLNEKLLAVEVPMDAETITETLQKNGFMFIDNIGLTTVELRKVEKCKLLGTCDNGIVDFDCERFVIDLNSTDVSGIKWFNDRRFVNILHSKGLETTNKKYVILERL